MTRTQWLLIGAVLLGLTVAIVPPIFLPHEMPMSFESPRNEGIDDVA